MLPEALQQLPTEPEASEEQKEGEEGEKKEGEGDGVSAEPSREPTQVRN